MVSSRMRGCGAALGVSVLFALSLLALMGCGGHAGASLGESEMRPDGGESTSPGSVQPEGPDADVFPPGEDDDVSPPDRSLAPHPQFLTTHSEAVPPPPISGGTLLVTKSGTTAVAADPDRDAVYVVDLATKVVRFTVPLNAGDEPGRAVEDGRGIIHVALRGGGSLVDIDPARGVVNARRALCPAPRGVAWDSATDLVWTACATGELVGLPAGGVGASKRFVVERDLRDVLIDGANLVVSTFRSAELLHLDANGNVTKRDTIAPPSGNTVHVGWRTVANPSGGFVTLHQVDTTAVLQTGQPDSYGGFGVGAAVQCGVTVFGPSGPFTTVYGMPPTVDLAVSPDGHTIAMAVPGAAFCENTTTVSFQPFPIPVVASSDGGIPSSALVGAVAPAATPLPSSGVSMDGQPIAVAFIDAAHALVQTRQPANLVVVPLGATTGSDTIIPLSTVARDDTGHDIFHAQAGNLIACMSCHPEGADDGNVWNIDKDTRRTPSLLGTIQGTAPYHWRGDQKDFDALVVDVYVQRMGGVTLPSDQTGALQSWVQALHAPPAPSWVDSAAAARGKALFTDATIGCATCHSGDKLTNNVTVDIGTGGAVQVPPLVGVGWRAPFLHTGCAATLADRFGTCNTPQHGVTAGLTSGNVADLVAYLEGL